MTQDATEQFLKSWWQWRNSLPNEQRWMADAMGWSAAHAADVHAVDRPAPGPAAGLGNRQRGQQDALAGRAGHRAPPGQVRRRMANGRSMDRLPIGWPR